MIITNQLHIDYQLAQWVHYLLFKCIFNSQFKIIFILSFQKQCIKSIRKGKHSIQSGIKVTGILLALNAFNSSMQSYIQFFRSLNKVTGSSARLIKIMWLYESQIKKTAKSHIQLQLHDRQMIANNLNGSQQAYVNSFIILKICQSKSFQPLFASYTFSKLSCLILYGIGGLDMQQNSQHTGQCISHNASIITMPI